MLLKEAIFYRIGSVILSWLVTYMILGSVTISLILTGILFFTHTIYYISFQKYLKRKLIKKA